MTHHTDAERAEFEAWYIWHAKEKNACLAEYTDDEIRDSLMWRIPEENGAYGARRIQIAWETWQQSARRAPAAPAPQNVATHNKNLNGFIDFANQIDFAKPRSASLKRKLILETRDAILDLFNEQLKLHRKIDALAAAPQPPEVGCSVSNGETQAAPVQMPNPAAWCTEVYTDKSLGFERREYKLEAVPFAEIGFGEKLYTEQQVRELLAAQASVSNGTLPSQPTFKTEDGVEAREPLTDEEILDISGPHSKDMRWPSTPIDIARAIERAHGIGVDKP